MRESRSSLNLWAGYLIFMAEADKHETAFKTPTVLYEFNRMPLGLTTATSTFQQAVDAV